MEITYLVTEGFTLVAILTEPSPATVAKVAKRVDRASRDLLTVLKLDRESLMHPETIRLFWWSMVDVNWREEYRQWKRALRRARH